VLPAGKSPAPPAGLVRVRLSSWQSGGLTPLRLHAGVGAFLAQCFIDDRSAYFSLGMILHQLVCRRPNIERRVSPLGVRDGVCYSYRQWKLCHRDLLLKPAAVPKN
jgi:hypothetical protein